jgi:hypothetical protein
MFKSLIILALITLACSQSAFLQTPTPEDIPEEIIETVTGFIDGIIVFSNVPDFKKCETASGTAINGVVDLVRAFELIGHSDPETIYKSVFHAVAEFATGMEQSWSPCQAYGEEEAAKWKILGPQFADPKYWQEFSTNLLFNLGTLTQKVQDIIKNINAKNFYETGKGVGDIVHFALFWKEKALE